MNRGLCFALALIVATQASAVRKKERRAAPTVDTCVDKVDCSKYASSVCKDYGDWAKDNCAAFCGICKPLHTTAPPPCEDVKPNCPEYGLDSCTKFAPWAHENCRKYCGFCQVQSTGFYGQCFYQGKTYKQGEKWEDGCSYNCECVDGSTGAYKCTNKCPVYNNLPTACTLVSTPGDCCLHPVCDFNKKVVTSQGSALGHTASGVNVCVYNGNNYYQGQTWAVGCDLRCTCNDATQGSYRCQSFCPQYGKLPTDCVMTKDPAQCCASPQCTFSKQFGSFSGSGSVSGAGITMQGPTAETACVDKLPNCPEFTKDACPKYPGWAGANCKKFCNLCHQAQPTPGPNDACVYQGQRYTQGQTWAIGCDQRCVCENAIYGYYRCSNTCPTYDNLPTQCHTQKKVSDCCETVRCSSGSFYSSSTNLQTTGSGGGININGVTPNPSTGSGQGGSSLGTGMQPPQLSGCLYNGQLYVQDQQWEDKCSTVCTCNDASTGIYACRERCPRFDGVPAGCQMITDPSDKCCKVPQCPPSITYVAKPVYQPWKQTTSLVKPPSITDLTSGFFTNVVTINFSGGTVAPPTLPTGTVQSGGIGYCEYKGRHYLQNERWEDGCKYNCICERANDGFWRCLDRCKTYPTLPKDICWLIPDPSDACCQIPFCKFYPKFPAIYGTGHPGTFTTPPYHPKACCSPEHHPPGQVRNCRCSSDLEAFCVYKGQNYAQGQQWYDGCSMKCSCDNAESGYYRCSNRCPLYYNVPKGCTELPDPMDPTCCTVPHCDFKPTSGSISGTGSQATIPPGQITGTGQNPGENQKIGYCLYKKVKYNQGQKWTDGCQYNCECEDADKGTYRCTAMCPRYASLPQQCRLVTDFANPCCQLPECDFQGTSGGLTGAGHVTPSPGPQPTCTYNTAKYYQGQTWKDGCSKSCRCEDAVKGLYVCDDRCPTFGSMPPQCQMVTDPADPCCQKPQCRFVPTSGSTTGSGTPNKIPTLAPAIITGQVPTPKPGQTPTPVTVCTYKGQQYHKGQTWQDGCSYNCECLDDQTGKYKCTERCPRFAGLPPQCNLMKNPSDPCCQVPVCDFSTNNGGLTGQGQLTPAPDVTPKPKGMCVYKGTSYATGQQWFDGCDYTCDCENGDQGIYRCNKRCAMYDNLPKECHLEADPQDPFCCKRPACSFIPTSGSQTGNALPSIPPGTITGGSVVPTPNPNLSPSLGPGVSPTPGPGMVPLPKDVCVYKGKQYAQGAKWQDGCLYNCECLDAHAGKYKCTEQCPKFAQIPPQCRLVRDIYNPCCQTPVCNFSPTSGQATGSGVPPTPPAQKDFCVYNGANFKQGATWNDGCDLVCTCEDAKTGVYRCDERCANYKAQSGCSMVADPKDKCCKIPFCQPVLLPSPQPGVNPGQNPTPFPYPVPTGVPGTIHGQTVNKPNTNNPTNASFCTYNNINYKTGQKWEDGCQYSCVCDDEKTGKYTCLQKCTPYSNIPAYCTLVVDPQEPCCKKPSCQNPLSLQTTAAPVPGVSPTPNTNNINTPLPQPTCVYKNQRYNEGQEWYDGCDKKCVCEDGKNNYYRCSSRCASYGNIPPQCRLVADPKDPQCCQVPQCTPTPGPNGYPTPGPGVSPTPFNIPTGVVTGVAPTPTPGPGGQTPPPRHSCVYKGREYRQGERWQDGCKYNCVCEDETTGKYKCGERCPSYPFVPPQCTLQRDLTDICCNKLTCDYSKPTVNPYATPKPNQTPSPVPKFCVYKGVVYKQNQVWTEGCDKKCRCDDADTNFYNCYDRCPSYSNPPPGCTLIVDPKDSCCQVPQCLVSPTLAPGATPNPNPGQNPTPNPYPVPTAVPGTITGQSPNHNPLQKIGYCMYKGVKYTKGQTWQDGCSMNCECLDDNTGQYKCTERCPNYVNIPSYCILVKDPRDNCCLTPTCPGINPNPSKVSPSPGTNITPTPGTPKLKDVCVYNGRSYTQGQEWYDGCDKKCVCEDGTTGFVRCTDRCAYFNSIAPNCVMVPDPKDPSCCLAPQCDQTNKTVPTGVIGHITGYGLPPTPQPMVSPAPGVSTPAPVVTLTPPLKDVCVYKGTPYKQGQRWQDGCDYTCVCEDATTGKYDCSDICPRYPNLPYYCTMTYDPTNPCCQKPECHLPSPTKTPGVSPSPGATQTPTASFCVYNGIPYRQGQNWQVGCDKVCRCEDSVTNLIDCDDRCPSYPQTPSDCVLITDPSDKCCQVPSCGNSPNTNNPSHTIKGVPGTITGQMLPPDNMNPLPLKNACVYNGKTYHQGETWEDGCTYDCECIDSADGKYRCTEKCPAYPQVPSYCTMIQDPQDKCCEVPYCPTLVPPMNTLYPTPYPIGYTPYPGATPYPGPSKYPIGFTPSPGATPYLGPTPYPIGYTPYPGATPYPGPTRYPIGFTPSPGATPYLGPTPYPIGYTPYLGATPYPGPTPYPIGFTPSPGATPYHLPTPWPIGFTPFPGATPYPGPSKYPIGFTPSPGATPYLGPTPYPIGYTPYPGATPYPGPSKYPIGFIPSPGATPYPGPTPWPIGYTPSPGATPYAGPNSPTPYPIGYTPSPGATPYLGPTPSFIGYTPWPGATPYPGPSKYPIGFTPSPGATPYLGPTPYPIGYTPWPGATPYPGPSKYPIGFTPSPGATPYLGPTPYPIGYTPYPGATPYPGPTRYPFGFTPSPGATPYLGPTPYPIGYIPYPGATPYPGPSKYPIGFTPSPGATPYLGPTPYPIGYTPWPGATPYPGPTPYPIGFTPSPGATPYHIPTPWPIGYTPVPGATPYPGPTPYPIGYTPSPGATPYHLPTPWPVGFTPFPGATPYPGPTPYPIGYTPSPGATPYHLPTPWPVGFTPFPGATPYPGPTPYPIGYTPSPGATPYAGPTPYPIGYTPFPGATPYPGPSKYPIGYTPSPGATPYLGPTPYPIGFTPYPGATPYPGPSKYPIGYTPSPGATPYLGPTPYPIGYTPWPGATPYPGPSLYMPIGYTPSPGATPYLGPTPYPIGYVPYPGATPYPGPSKYPIGFTPSPGATPYLGPTPYPVGFTPSPGATPYPGPSKYPIGFTPFPGATPYLGPTPYPIGFTPYPGATPYPGPSKYPIGFVPSPGATPYPGPTPYPVGYTPYPGATPYKLPTIPSTNTPTTPYPIGYTPWPGATPYPGPTPYPIGFTPSPGATPYHVPTPWPIGYKPYPGATPYPGPTPYPIGFTPSPGATPYLGPTPYPIGYTPYPGATPYPGPSKYPIGFTPSPGATPYLGPTPYPIGYTPWPGATPYPGPSKYPIGFTPSPGATPYLGPTPYPIGYVPYPGATPYPGPTRYPIGFTPSPGATPYRGPTPYPIGYTPYPGATPYPGLTPYPIGFTPSPGATPYRGPTPYPVGYTPWPGATPYPGPTPYPIGFTPSPGATPYHVPTPWPIGYTPYLGATPYPGPTPYPIGYTPSPGATPFHLGTPWPIGFTPYIGATPYPGPTPYPIGYTPSPGATPYKAPTPWPIGYTPYLGATPYPGPTPYPIGYTPSPGATPYKAPTPWPIGFTPYPGATPYPGPTLYPPGFTPSPGATPYQGPTPYPIGYTPFPGATPYPGPTPYPIGYTPSPGATPYLGPTPYPIGFVPYPGATPYPGPSRWPIGFTPSPGATPYKGPTPYPIGYTPWPGATPYPGPTPYPIGFIPYPGATPYLGPTPYPIGYVPFPGATPYPGPSKYPIGFTPSPGATPYLGPTPYPIGYVPYPGATPYPGPSKYPIGFTPSIGATPYLGPTPYPVGYTPWLGATPYPGPTPYPIGFTPSPGATPYRLPTPWPIGYTPFPGATPYPGPTKYPIGFTPSIGATPYLGPTPYPIGYVPFPGATPYPGPSKYPIGFIPYPGGTPYLGPTPWPIGFTPSPGATPYPGPSKYPFGFTPFPGATPYLGPTPYPIGYTPSLGATPYPGPSRYPIGYTPSPGATPYLGPTPYPIGYVPYPGATPYPGPTPIPGYTPMTGVTQAPRVKGMCEYNNQYYKEGQLWYDGCNKVCRCESADFNFHRCQDRCTKYDNIQSSCLMVPDPKDPSCCKKPQCPVPTPAPGVTPTPGFISVTPVPGYINGYGKPPTMAPGVSPSPGSQATPSPTGCMYKGQVYNKGQKWEDGCDSDCECLDDATGQYKCTKKCPAVPQLPNRCVLLQDPTNPCCKRPFCDFMNPTPFPGGVPTPNPILNPSLGPNQQTTQKPGPGVSNAANHNQGQTAGFCMYKGVPYQKGQTWSDACDKTCVCDDPTNNLYTCRDRCSSFNNLAPTCTLETDPNDPCCVVPDCNHLPPVSLTPGTLPGINGTSNPLNPYPSYGPGFTGQPTYIQPTGIPGTFTGNSGFGSGNPGQQVGGMMSGMRNMCVYKGTTYSQGQTWSDGCNYNCECIDAVRGKYRCNDRCGKYYFLPPQCMMVADPKDSCCKVAKCDSSLFYVSPYPGTGPSGTRTTPNPNTVFPIITGGHSGITPAIGTGPSGSRTTPNTQTQYPVITGSRPPNMCMYTDGKLYAKGQSWADGCTYTCVCQDPVSNDFRCTMSCTAFSSLPSYCTLQKIPGDQCCMQPVCSYNGKTYIPMVPDPLHPTTSPTLNPSIKNVIPIGTHQIFSGSGSQPGTSYTVQIGGRSACYYKGTLHQQGTSWDDACDFTCTCEVGKNGIYRCISKCPAYPATPSYCHYVTVPGQCCRSLTCSVPGINTPYNPTPQINPTPVPTLAPGQTPAPTTNPQIIVGPGVGSQFGGSLPGGGATVPPGMTSIMAGRLNKCIYQNKMYNMGERWDDGCNYQCECLDGNSGYYKCIPKCADYTKVALPKACYMVKAPGGCCDVPVCKKPDGTIVDPVQNPGVYPVFGSFTGGFTGFRPGFNPYGTTNTIGGRLNACVYKSTVYQVGQKWDDGCDFNCECLDAQTGRYRCIPKCHLPVCNLYTTAPMCRMIDVPGQCCKQVSCLSPTNPGPTYSTGGANISPQAGVCPPKDKLDNCAAFGQYSCKAPYEAWARENCPIYCGICQRTVSTTPPPCVDKLDNCDMYGKASCGGLYLGWAGDNCRKYCDLCTTTAPATQAPSQSSCADKLSNCNSYGSYICTGQYESWARDNCAMTCNYCGTTAPPHTNTGYGLPPANWAILMKGVAGMPGDLYSLWSSPSTLNANQPQAMYLTSTYPGHYKPDLSNNWNSCHFDQIRVAIYNQGLQKAYVTFNAVGADKMSWFSPSRIIDSSWGDIKSIPKNFFQMAGDSLTGREFYMSNTGTGCSSSGWMMVSTRGGCPYENPSGKKPAFYYAPGNTMANWQTTQPQSGDVFAILAHGGNCITGNSPYTTPAPLTGSTNVCIYKGHTYKEGETWADGCEYNCTCVDGSRGQYNCRGLCPIYNNLDPACTLVKKPGQCCSVPDCPQSQQQCLYKGQSYGQGKTWRDGCDFQCTCVDATKGMYNCKALCLQWQLPPVCKLLAPPAGKCCPTPSCPSGMVINYPPGYIDV
ncbi:uncharacterized protein LOC124278355 [Haliotis rubra]|uniref:uncharacterized protein LOC124278355 n=1 Tax=Haliotis rubra TaxID=36100 RepID=UPI001EE4EDB7|nr:uncharacterized protein LOC124278355 [Haliotis rubra]